MIALLLCILLNVGIFLWFRRISDLKLPILPVVVINYACCAVIGIVINWTDLALDLHQILEFWYVIPIISVLFIFGFFITGETVKFYGVNTATVIAKNAFVLTAIYGIFFLQEDVSGIKILALILAVLAVFLISPPKRNSHLPAGIFFQLLPLLLFLDNALIEIAMTNAQSVWFKAEQFGTVVTLIFLCAGIIGLAVLPITKRTGLSELTSKPVAIAGLILGAINYGSMYFLLVALDIPGKGGSDIFPINNAGIVALSFIGALIIFKEKPKPIKWIGILCAIIASLLIWMGK